MRNNPSEPSGSASASSSSRSNRGITDPSSSNTSSQIPCKYPGCGRSFGTVRGLGVHCHKAHPNWTDENTKIVHKKEQWSLEEISRMARMEAQLTHKRVRFINQELIKYFTSRSIEAIKGKRRDLSYKQKVQEYLADLPLEDESDDDEHAKNDEDEGIPETENVNKTNDQQIFDENLYNYIRNLPMVRDDDYNTDELFRICRSARPGNKETIYNDISNYIIRLINTINNNNNNNKDNKIGMQSNKQNTNVQNGMQNKERIYKNKKQARRHEYTKTQEMWRMSPSRCLKHILKDIHAQQYPSKELIIPFWEKVMSKEDANSPMINEQKDTIHELWNPVSNKEIKSAMPETNSAAGPDGLKARDLRSIPVGILAGIFNILLWCGRIPKYLLESRTTLIPKKSEMTSPGDLRPITVSSVLIRALHKVLANRMSKLVDLDRRQKAFRKLDGCAESVVILDLILRSHHGRNRSLYMASLDVAKAFDSVNHQTIIKILEHKGVPQPMIDYIAYVYANSTTKLKCKDWISHAIKPKCGVKQGDPLSPIIFNCVIDGLLKSLPNEIGAQAGGTTVNAIAYADDLLLFASTTAGLQQLLDITADYLALCGMEINVNKCLTTAIRNVPHAKKTIVDKTVVFKAKDEEIRTLKRTEQWTYLGIAFTPEGKALAPTLPKLIEMLIKLTKAPLKPQQRLFALRTTVLPGVQHQLVLGETKLTLLKRVDVEIRKYVRKWLNLPHDVPNAYIHAAIKDGGLGIPAMRWDIPYLRLKRINSFLKSTTHAINNDLFMQKEITRLNKRLLNNGLTMDTAFKIKKFWSKALYESVDGKALKQSRDVQGQHSWVAEPTKFLSGRDYINFIKTRINALPVRSRTARGRRKDKMCRAGCYNVETLNHILQNCHRTHDVRIRRHNAITSYIVHKLKDQEYKVHEEPHLHTNAGLRKPDIIACRGVTAVVIDAQVVSEQADLLKAHNNKKNYYQSLEDQIKDNYKVRNVIFTSATLSWRGIWSRTSAEDLVSYGLIRRSDIKVISTRVLMGAMVAFNCFNRRTTWKRQGVG